MARTVSNPGRTARFYQHPKNRESRLKHIRDNSNGGKYDKPAKYQREHQAARRKNNTPPGKDVVRNKKGNLVNGDRYGNRADGGRLGARRRMAKKNSRLKIA
tara:strand:- start:155 stop:460 length:306 start_codon:yes stop_codon:yes gene_type:complete